MAAKLNSTLIKSARIQKLELDNVLTLVEDPMDRSFDEV